MSEQEREYNRLRGELNKLLSSRSVRKPLAQLVPTETILKMAGNGYSKGFVLISLAFSYFENALDIVETIGFTNLAISKANNLMEDAFDAFWKTLCTQLHLTKEQLAQLSQDCDKYRTPIDRLLDDKEQ